MNIEDKNLKVEKSLNYYQDNKTSEKVYSRDKLKSKIMDKFNIDSDKAEKIILEIENKEYLILSKNNKSSHDCFDSNISKLKDANNNFIENNGGAFANNNNFKNEIETKNQYSPL